MWEKVDALLVLKQWPKLTEQEKLAIDRINAFFELHTGTPIAKEDKAFLDTLDPEKFKETALKKAATEAKAAWTILKKYSTISYFLEDQRPSETWTFESLGVTLPLPWTPTSIELQRHTDIRDAVFVDKWLLVFENNVSRWGKTIPSWAKFRDLATGKVYLIQRAQSTPAEKRTYTVHPENVAASTVPEHVTTASNTSATQRTPEYAYIDESSNTRIVYTAWALRLPCVVSKGAGWVISYVVAGHPITFDKTWNASYVQGEKTKILLHKTGESITASLAPREQAKETAPTTWTINLWLRPIRIEYTGETYRVSYTNTPWLENRFREVPFAYEWYTIAKNGTTYTATEIPAMKQINSLKDDLYKTYGICVAHTIAWSEDITPRDAPHGTTDVPKMIETMQTLQNVLARYYTPQEIKQWWLTTFILAKNVWWEESAMAWFYVTGHNGIILDIFKNQDTGTLSSTITHELQHYFDASDGWISQNINLANENLARDMLDQIEGNEQLLQLTHIEFIINNDYAVFTSADNKKSKDIILAWLKNVYLDLTANRVQLIADRKQVTPSMLALSNIATDKNIYDQFRAYLTALSQNTLAHAQPSLYAMSSLNESDAEFTSSLLDTEKIKDLLKNCSPYPAIRPETPRTPAQILTIKIELQTGCKLKWNGNTCIGFDRKIAREERSERPYSNKEEAVTGARKAILSAAEFPAWIKEIHSTRNTDKQRAGDSFDVSLNVFTKWATAWSALLDEILASSVCSERLLLRIKEYLTTTIKVENDMYFCRKVWQSAQWEKAKRMFTGPHFSARSARWTKWPAYRNSIKDSAPTLPRAPVDNYIQRLCALDEYTEDEIRLQSADGQTVEATYMIAAFNSEYIPRYIRSIYPTPPTGLTFEEITTVLTPKILAAISPIPLNETFDGHLYVRKSIGIDFFESYKSQAPIGKQTLAEIKCKLFAWLLNQKWYGPEAIKRLVGSGTEQIKSQNTWWLDQNPKITATTPAYFDAIVEEARRGIDGDWTPVFWYNGSDVFNAKDLYTKINLWAIDLFGIQSGISSEIPTQLLYHTLFESNRMLTPEDLLANPFGERLLVLLGYTAWWNEIINMLHPTEKWFIAYCYGVLKMCYELPYRPSKPERAIRDPALTIAQKKQQLQSIEDTQFPHKWKTKGEWLAYLWTPDYRSDYQAKILGYATPYANILKCTVATSNILLGLTGSKNTSTPTGIGNYEWFGTWLISFSDKPSATSSASIEIWQKNDKDLSFCLTAYGIEDSARESQTAPDTVEVKFWAYTIQLTYNRSTNTFAFKKGIWTNMWGIEANKLTDKQWNTIATLTRWVVTISKAYLPSSGFVMVKATTAAPDDVWQIHIACEKPVKSLTKEVLAFSLSESIVTFDSNTATIRNAETVVADVQSMLSTTITTYNTSNWTTYTSLNDYLQKNTSTKIYLVGHTDNDGDEPANVALSLRRSEAVKELLLTNAIIDQQFADRIITSWSGESQPVGDNTTPENKRKNRRVEMMVF